MKAQIITPLALLAVAGCSSSDTSGYKPKDETPIPVASVEAGKEDVLFPHAKGNRWRYKSTNVRVEGGQTAGTPQDFYWEISDSKDTARGTEITIDTIKKDEVVTDRMVWLIAKDGIFQLSQGLDSPQVFTPPQPVVTFPLKLDEELPFSGSGPSPFTDPAKAPGELPTRRSGQITGTNKITAPEEVDTEGGRVSAYRIESRSTTKAGKNAQGLDLIADALVVSYWVPNVGIVRLEQTQTAATLGKATKTRLVLSDKTLK